MTLIALDLNCVVCEKTLAFTHVILRGFQQCTVVSFDFSDPDSLAFFVVEQSRCVFVALGSRLVKLDHAHLVIRAGFDDK